MGHKRVVEPRNGFPYKIELSVGRQLRKETNLTRCASILRYEDVVLSNTGYSHKNARSCGSFGASGLIKRHPGNTNAVTCAR